VRRANRPKATRAAPERIAVMSILEVLMRI
jgi:hypothetical protein